jgi:hypothetical protein
MEYNNIFENKRTNHQSYSNHRYQERPHYAQNMCPSYRSNHINYKLQYFLEYLKKSRKLKLAILITIILILAILIAAIVILLPIISKLIGFVDQNGVQGIVEALTDFLNKLWRGTSK